MVDELKKHLVSRLGSVEFSEKQNGRTVIITCTLPDNTYLKYSVTDKGATLVDWFCLRSVIEKVEK